MRHARKILAATVIVVVAALALPAVPAPAVVKATGSFTWNPSFKHIVKGRKVVWKNPTGISHKLRAYGGNWSKNVSIPSGGKTVKIFGKKGTFKYRCDRPGHSTLSGGTCTGMCGRIHVTAS